MKGRFRRPFQLSQWQLFFDLNFLKKKRGAQIPCFPGLQRTPCIYFRFKIINSMVNQLLAGGLILEKYFVS